MLYLTTLLFATTPQVCELIDFGVHGMEYWIVLEAGKMDLRAWRLNINSEKSSASEQKQKVRLRYSHFLSNLCIL